MYCTQSISILTLRNNPHRLLANSSKIARRLGKDRAIRSIVGILKFSDRAPFARSLEPLYKILSHPASSEAVNRILVSPKSGFVARALQLVNQHSESLARLQLLKILLTLARSQPTLCTASQYPAFEETVNHLARNDASVLVQSMASHLIRELWPSMPPAAPTVMATTVGSDFVRVE